MSHLSRLLTLPIFSAMVVLAPIWLTAAPDPARAETTRRVFFSAVDDQGAPVTNLTAADLTVKEGGKERTVATLRPATGKFQVSILVDDGGGGFFQLPVAHFLGQTLGKADVAVSILNPQPVKLVDYTSDTAALQAAAGKLSQRGRVEQDGLQLIEAVSWAAKELRSRESPRPVIIAITSGGEPGYTEVGDFILNDLKASGASLHVLYVNGVDLGKVLGDGPKYSGGLAANAASTQDMAAAMLRVAAHLQNQYELTYILPDGTKPNDRLQLQTSRKGVKLLAPERISDK
jgi:hypothetical protein